MHCLGGCTRLRFIILLSVLSMIALQHVFCPLLVCSWCFISCVARHAHIGFMVASVLTCTVAFTFGVYIRSFVYARVRRQFPLALNKSYGELTLSPKPLWQGTEWVEKEDFDDALWKEPWCMRDRTRM